jgi:hypothetical protein
MRNVCCFVSPLLIRYDNSSINVVSINTRRLDQRYCKRTSTTRCSHDGYLPLIMTPWSIHLLDNPIISAFASVLKCKLKPTTAADVSAFTSNLSVFTANTVNR